MRQLPYTAGASVHVGADRFDAAITEEISDDLLGLPSDAASRPASEPALRSGHPYPIEYPIEQADGRCSQAESNKE